MLRQQRPQPRQVLGAVPVNIIDLLHQNEICSHPIPRDPVMSDPHYTSSTRAGAAHVHPPTRPSRPGQALSGRRLRTRVLARGTSPRWRRT